MSLIASTATDLKFHQWPAGDIHQTYVPPNCDKGPIKTISWSKDGCWVVLVPNLGCAEVISIKESVKTLDIIDDVQQPTCAVFQNSTKRFIALGTMTGQMLVYDIKSKGIRSRFPRLTSSIFRLDYNSRDTHLAAACSNGDIIVYNSISSNVSSSYRFGDGDTVSAISFHRTKRNLLAAGSQEGVIMTWDINTNNVQCQAQPHQAPISDTAFSPLRADLLASGGLDRKFSFYDLLSKKCILEVEVSNAITALDYSSCGMFLGIGSQNGMIVIYDTRNFKNPVSTFHAHDGRRVHNVSFQKSGALRNESVNTVDYTEEFVRTDADTSAAVDTKPQTLMDSFKLACEDICITPKDEPRKSTPHDRRDSFMVAMGLDSTENTTRNDSLKSYRPNPRSRLTSVGHTCTPSAIQEAVGDGLNGQIASSTPILNHARGNSTVSPIANETSPLPPHISVENMQNIIRDVVKQEVHRELDEFKSEMKHEFSQALAQIRRNFLDLQMTIVKEFVEMESTVQKFSRAREYVFDEMLLRQNNALQNGIEIFKEQMADKDFLP